MPGAEVSDQLKYFSERLPATFVYAGIDVERGGLFTGTRGRQIASRFATIATKPFGYATTAQRDQWHRPPRGCDLTPRDLTSARLPGLIEG